MTDIKIPARRMKIGALYCRNCGATAHRGTGVEWTCVCGHPLSEVPLIAERSIFDVASELRNHVVPRRGRLSVDVADDADEE